MNSNFRRIACNTAIALATGSFVISSLSLYNPPTTKYNHMISMIQDRDNAIFDEFDALDKAKTPKEKEEISKFYSNKLKNIQEDINISRKNNLESYTYS